MLPFLLHFSVALVLAATFSASLLVLPHLRKKASETLPLSISEGTGFENSYDGEEGEMLSGVRDPFDIVTPDDVADGIPLDEQNFWRKVKLSKIVLLAVLCMLFISHSVSIGYNLISDSKSLTQSLLPPIFHLFLTIYLIALTASSITVTEVEEHWPIVIHISTLVGLSFLAQCISVLLPNDGSVTISTMSSLNNHGVLSPLRTIVKQIYRRSSDAGTYDDDTAAFWHSSLALTFIIAAIATTIPRGPDRYFPPEQVYTLKSIEIAARERGELAEGGHVPKTPKRQEKNVCGIVASSVLGVLLFDYTTSVVMLGYTSASLEIADLPILPGNMRATSIFSRMRHLVHSAKYTSTTALPTALSEFHFTAKVPFANQLVEHFPNLEQRVPWILHSKIVHPFKFEMSRHSSAHLLFQLAKANKIILTTEVGLAACSALTFYTPAFFFRKLIIWLENDPRRGSMGQPGAEVDTKWAWVYCAGLFGTTAVMYLLTAQLWSIATTVVQLQIKVQLNTMLFAKTLVRKNIASTASNDSNGKDENKDGKKDAPKGQTTNGTASPDTATVTAGSTTATGTTAINGNGPATEAGKETVAKKEEDEFSSKAQVMTLMTTDVDRVSDFAWHLFSLVDSPIEIFIGGYFLYTLLGVSAFWGLGASLIFVPINHWASKIVVKAQDDLMKARDERVALMNEVLGGIRMLKFMAWERSFERRITRVREKELSFQWRNYVIETVFNTTWLFSPIIVTVVAFWHYTVIRNLPLTPATAFTSLTVFTELRFALAVLPETFINLLQSFVSLRRISKYLATQEVTSVSPLHEQSPVIALNSATITWPQERIGSAAGTGSSTPGLHEGTASVGGSNVSTPRRRFILVDLSLNFPEGELSLICGKLGSGKTLLLLALLGEADLLAGQILCPRSPPDAVANFMNISEEDEWVVPNMCAYVPQMSWLQNASIKENILFNLPENEERYQATLEACALTADLKILEDGDESEIGERGVNLSGGQKARVSLARAVYSRASILLLDDVLAAVDAHTAKHLFEKCLRGPLLKGRTVILVSHHVQLCAPKAEYIVALEKGRLVYQGGSDGFMSSPVMESLIQTRHIKTESEDAAPVEETVEDIAIDLEESKEQGIAPSTEVTIAEVADAQVAQRSKPPRKLIEDEARAVGRIGRGVWLEYVRGAGGVMFWGVFVIVLVLASLAPVAENGWIKVWSGAVNRGDTSRTPQSYLTIYALITVAGLAMFTLRFFVLYRGSIHASAILHKKLLKSILFAPIRFHDTTNRGRLLNRFGKDFEGIDSSLADNFGRSVFNLASVVTTIVTVSFVGGLPFLGAFIVLSIFYFEVARIYGQTARDMRRLDSVSRSPLYSIYGEAIAGVPIVRAFGASSKFLRDMLRCVDTNASPYYWLWGVNRWISVRFNMLSATIIGITAIVILVDTKIDASYAGLAMTFIMGLTGDILFLVRRFVSLEQSMVAVERVKEFSELDQEPAEFIEPRPPAIWPSTGSIEVENLSVRYARDLPDVLHDLTFSITSGQKVGVLGRTGSGKSTLAQSFFRFVEASEGKIFIDGVDISTIGLTDLRSRLTIIPQDPTILSGTLRSTLDIFEEYEDAEIYEALRRVHLIPSSDEIEVNTDDEVNQNVFRNLDSPVSEAGENFSAGEKQLICMARAILKRTKVLFMDEATASVDYATDELIGTTIRHEFADSTILTIAHRIRTIIDYDMVMVLDQGRIVEFDRPSVLLANRQSQFYALCKATGPEEFSALMRLSNASASS